MPNPRPSVLAIGEPVGPIITSSPMDVDGQVLLPIGVSPIDTLHGDVTDMRNLIIVVPLHFKNWQQPLSYSKSNTPVHLIWMSIVMLL